jgi:hypothetical protein
MEGMRKIILTTIALMLLSSVGYGADWKYIFTAPTGGKWFYDTQSITHGKDTTVVWTKWILSDKEWEKFIKMFPKEFKKKVTMHISGAEVVRTTDKLIDISYFIQKEEINCSKNVARIMSMSLFAFGGDLVWFSGDHTENQFEDVFLDSKGVTLIEAICKEGEGGK